MESWLPPNVPMDMWDFDKMLHHERLDAATCLAKYVTGTGDTRAYAFTTDRSGMVIGIEVWCDGLLEVAWERVKTANPRDIRWQQANTK